MIALRRNEPHWMLSDADQKRYGQALNNAMRHFPVHATQKAIDIGTAIFTVIEMDGTRIGKSVQLRRDRAQGRPQRGPAQVFQFHPQPAGAARPQASTASGDATVNPPPSAQQPPIADPPHPEGIGGDGDFGP